MAIEFALSGQSYLFTYYKYRLYITTPEFHGVNVVSGNPVIHIWNSFSTEWTLDLNSIFSANEPQYAPITSYDIYDPNDGRIQTYINFNIVSINL